MQNKANPNALAKQKLNSVIPHVYLYLASHRTNTSTPSARNATGTSTLLGGNTSSTDASLHSFKSLILKSPAPFTSSARFTNTAFHPAAIDPTTSFSNSSPTYTFSHDVDSESATGSTSDKGVLSRAAAAGSQPASDAEAS